MGITWGGGLYAALDPIFGVMLYKILGRQYRVIDKTAAIHFKRPVKTTVFARFYLSKQEVESIHDELQARAKLTRNYVIDLVDKEGVIHASCEKELCILDL